MFDSSFTNDQVPSNGIGLQRPHSVNMIVVGILSVMKMKKSMTNALSVGAILRFVRSLGGRATIAYEGKD